MKAVSAIFAIFSLFLFFPNFVRAQESSFNPHNIISDEELQNFNIWNQTDIQQFLKLKNSFLTDYQCANASGTVNYAAKIIYDAAQNFKINPKFILVTLQKEQSLITDPSPSKRQLDWATGYAACDGCDLNGDEMQKYRGFGNQVENSAALMRWYYENTNKSFVKKKNELISIDNFPVIPQSWATAFLYTYTPHLHGNENFQKIWNDWFGSFLPNGTLVQTDGSDEVWLIQDGKKRLFKSKAVLLSGADPRLIVKTTTAELNNYSNGTSISFSNYSLLNADGKTYLLDYDNLRPFSSAEVIRQIGYNPEEIISVSSEDIAAYNIGEPIVSAETHPETKIVYITKNGAERAYLLKNNQLNPLLDKTVAVFFSYLPVLRQTSETTGDIPISSQVIGFPNGALVMGGGQTFVIEDGRRRLIADQTTFNNLGYKQSNVVEVSEMVLIAVPEGEPLRTDHRLALFSPNDLPVEYASGTARDIFKSTLPAYLVAEYPSGKIIAGKNIDTRRSIASLTKLFSAFEVLSDDQFNLSASTAYTSAKHAAVGNSLQLINGEKIRNLDLLYAAITKSVNNAARMLAQASGLKEGALVEKFNKRARDWGMEKTQIADASGLNPKNMSTARDLLIGFYQILQNRDLNNALNAKEYKFTEILDKNKIKTHTLKNTNDLLFKPNKSYEILASKTGYLEEAGACLIQLVKSGKNDQKYVIITLGEKNYAKRFAEPDRLAELTVKGSLQISKKNN